MDPLTIQIGGDVTGIKRAAAVAVAEMNKVDKAAARTADIQAREAKKAADAAAREAKKASDASEREAKKASDTAAREAKKASDASEKEAKKAADAAAREAKKAADSQIKENKRAFDAQFISLNSLQAAGVNFTNRQIAEAKRLADALERTTKQTLTKEQVGIIAQNQVIQRANQARVKAAVDVAEKESKGFDLSKFAAEGLAGALTSVVGQMAAFSTFQAVVAAIAKMWSDMRESSYESAQNIGDVREKMLELAALRGRLGDTTTELRESLRFRSQTLQTEDAATAFQGQALNVGQSRIDAGIISKDDFGGLMEDIGGFQAAEGGDAGTYGKSAGVAPLMAGGGKPVTRKQTFDFFKKSFNLMQKGGFDFTSGQNQLVANQSQAQLFNTPDRMVATLAGLSTVTGPDKASTTMDQFIRGTTGALIRSRQPNVDGESMKQAEYLKKLGATDQMDPAQIGSLIAKDIQRQQAEDAQKGLKTNAYTYLGHHGYANAGDIDALMAWTQLDSAGIAKKFMAAAASPDGLTDAERDDKNYLSADVRLQRFRTSETAGKRRAEISDRAKDSYAAGPIERYKNYQKIGFNTLVNTGKLYGKESEWRDDFIWGGRQDIQKEVLDAAMNEAKRVGIPFQFGRQIEGGYEGMGQETVNPNLYQFPGVGEYDIGSTGARSVKENADLLEKIVAAIEARGGNVSEALLKKIADNSDKQLVASQRSAQAPLNAAPGGVQKRP